MRILQINLVIILSARVCGMHLTQDSKNRRNTLRYLLICEETSGRIK